MKLTTIINKLERQAKDFFIAHGYVNARIFVTADWYGKSSVNCKLAIYNLEPPNSQANWTYETAKEFRERFRNYVYYIKGNSPSVRCTNIPQTKWKRDMAGTSYGLNNTTGTWGRQPRLWTGVNALSFKLSYTTNIKAGNTFPDDTVVSVRLPSIKIDKIITNHEIVEARLRLKLV